MPRAETWKPVIGFETYYSVSSHGRVMRTGKGKSTRAGRVLTLRPKNGYFDVNLCCNGAQVSRYVHDLVARAFIGPPPTPAHEVRHKDGTRTNNLYTNLTWGTRLQNMQDKVAHKTTNRGEANFAHKLTDIEIDEIRELKGRLSATYVASKFGVSWRYIYKLWAHVARRYKTERKTHEEPK